MAKQSIIQDGFEFPQADWDGGIQLAAKVVQGQGNEGKYYLINASDIDWEGAQFSNVETSTTYNEATYETGKGDNYWYKKNDDETYSVISDTEASSYTGQLYTKTTTKLKTLISSTGKLLSILDDEFAKITAATGDLGDYVAQINSNTKAIELLNNSSTIEGSVEYKILQAISDYAKKSEVRIYDVDENSYISISENGVDDDGHQLYKISLSENFQNLLTAIGTPKSDSAEATGLFKTVDDLSDNVDKIQIVKEGTATEGYAATYTFTNADGQTTTINIPKDQFLKSVSYVAEKPSTSEGNSDSVEFPALRFEWQLDNVAITYVSVAGLVEDTTYDVKTGESFLKKETATTEGSSYVFYIDYDALKAQLETDFDFSSKIDEVKELVNKVQDSADKAQTTADSALDLAKSNKSEIGVKTNDDVIGDKVDLSEDLTLAEGDKYSLDGVTVLTAPTGGITLSSGTSYYPVSQALEETGLYKSLTEINNQLKWQII